MKAATHLTGTGCFQEATRKARYGHRDWVHYQTKDGARAEPKTYESVKRALLASGTRRTWTLICSDGTPMKGFWWLGLNIMRQMKRA